MSAAATSKLDFILRLVDRVSQPLGKVKTGFSDLATQGQKGLTQMAEGGASWVRWTTFIAHPYGWDQMVERQRAAEDDGVCLGLDAAPLIQRWTGSGEI
ncbi:hypothetical protein ACW9H6_18885 [Pseudomonas sp. SDO528_S397]